MGLVPLGLLLAVVVTVALGTAVVRRSPPSRETAVAAGRAHAVQSAGAALLLGFLAAGYVGATQLGNGSPRRAGHHRAAGADHLRRGAHARAGRRRADLAAAGGRGAAGAPRAPRAPRRRPALAGALGVGGRRAGRRHARRRRPPGRRRRPQLQPTGPTCPGRAGATASPFPGAFYGVPAGVGLLVLALTTAVALRIVANRPAVATGTRASRPRCAGPRPIGCSGWRSVFRCSSPAACSSSAAGPALGGDQHRRVRAAGRGRGQRRP